MPKIRNSYTANFKLKVIEFAVKNGNRAAGREYNVDEKCVRDWIKQKTELKYMDRRKRARRGKPAKWPELEEELKNWILQKRREDKRQVSTLAIRLRAKELAKEKGLDTFKGGRSWCHLFMKRNDLSVRAVTSVGQQLPQNWEQKLTEFHNFYSRVKSGVDLSQVGNMDEVPITFDMPETRTVDEKGKKSIILTTTGAEKCNFTVILCCTADGGKCHPMVIFKRKTMPKITVPKGIVVTVSPKGNLIKKNTIILFICLMEILFLRLDEPRSDETVVRPSLAKTKRSVL
jgi:hypothetical protein